MTPLPKAPPVFKPITGFTIPKPPSLMSNSNTGHVEVIAGVVDKHGSAGTMSRITLPPLILAGIAGHDLRILSEVRGEYLSMTRSLAKTRSNVPAVGKYNVFIGTAIVAQVRHANSKEDALAIHKKYYTRRTQRGDMTIIMDDPLQVTSHLVVHFMSPALFPSKSDEYDMCQLLSETNSKHRIQLTK